MNKPRLFIGSSKEHLSVARLIQEQLETDALGIVWDQGIFGISRTTLSSLLRTLDTCQAAVFVLTPDDVATIRHKKQNITRDNVIFELGLFMGRLGPTRTFMLAPEKTDDFRLPTDWPDGFFVPA